MKAGCLQILGVETCIHSLTLYVVEHRVRHYCGDDLSGGQRTWSPVSTLVWSTNRLTGSRHSVATSIALPDWTASQRSILPTLARTHTRREREREREREHDRADRHRGQRRCQNCDRWPTEVKSWRLAFVKSIATDRPTSVRRRGWSGDVRPASARLSARLSCHRAIQLLPGIKTPSATLLAGRRSAAAEYEVVCALVV